MFFQSAGVYSHVSTTSCTINQSVSYAKGTCSTASKSAWWLAAKEGTSHLATGWVSHNKISFSQVSLHVCVPTYSWSFGDTKVFNSKSGLRPGVGHCVVWTLDKKLYSTLSLSTQCINGYQRQNAGGSPVTRGERGGGLVTILLVTVLHVTETGRKSNLMNRNPLPSNPALLLWTTATILPIKTF